MATSSSKIFYWIPRGLGILMAAFITIFAADAWNEGIVGVLMHLIPTAIMTLLLLVVWRWEKIGGAIYVALGLWYIFEWGARFDWTSKALIGGVPILIGMLFFFLPERRLSTR